MSNLNINGTLKFNQIEENSKQILIDLIYPIKSIYITEDPDFDPNFSWGGVWDPLPDNYTLWASSDNLGETISAGLPNITGNIYKSMLYDGRSSDGVFTTSDDGKSVTASGGHGAGIDSYNVNFNASRSNSIYGKSTTVQPPAIRVKMWKRIN